MNFRIRGVKKVRAKGRVYYYHRKTMIRLPGLPGSTAFMDAIARAERNKIEPDVLPGTLGAIISAYRASPEFRSLRERTQRDYQKVLNFLVPLAQLPLTEIGPRQIYEIRDAAFERKKRRFAN